MSNTDRDSMLERWADGMERLEQYYEGIYGPPATPPSLPPITTYYAMLEAIADGMERAKRNINRKSTTYHSDSVAYTKTVPAGDVHYASLEQIGGRTLVWNQLVNSGTTSVATISGHKYYTLISGTASIVNGGSAITIVDDTADMVCDLTLLYGSGNEPSTVAEFTAQFPAQYYPYNAGTLLSAGVTEVVSKKANDTTLATYPIPTAIQQIEGYGWSARNAYNYIDLERKVFVKNVARVDLGTLVWGSSTSSGKKYFYSSTLADSIKYISGYNNKINNIIYPYGSTGTFVNAYYGNFDCIGVGGSGVNEGRVGIYDSTKEEMTNAEFKASVSGVYAYYELATPQEIDISAYLTDDNIIEVESGGTLSFPNALGDDYKIDVPSSVTFVVGEP